ncbi:L-type lectin-domain containing receptor kinase S.4-like [Dendrobium catenatum]|uniref:non-specific serine/threonine protein kinase n=1 Tax=Dendrobium catenatum TaxID=906689 RepID=A0A2I0WK84_9ASPA|nr:L-type lectin-domain containing receptor kinase S.4-like [Dendrobium catenatum]PKU76070.1 L-type lectin-domain containing receptor kinase S.4 [Dendrobium catenatum]
MSKTFFILFLSSLSLLSALAQREEFEFSGFNSGNSNGNIALSGIAEVDNDGILRLTNDTRRLIGHAFYRVPIRFKNSTDGYLFSFSTTFAFAIVPEYPKLGGHGLAFTIANSSSLPDALPSQYLGLLNAKNIGNASNHLFAVEFDTVQDFEFGDINDNHVGIDLNNLASNKSVPASVNLKSGDTTQVWVDYDSARKVLDVWLANTSTKPANPIISYAVDLSPIFLNEMYVGFSASTGLLASSHYLFGWNFKMNGVAKSLDLSSLPSLPKPKKKNYALLIAAPVSALLFLIAALATAGYLIYKIKTADVIEDWELVTGPHRFSYKELKYATKRFREKELLGQGGFGKVYRGVLPGTKEEVAVKRVSHESKQGLREFVAEIASIGRLRHRNLVRMQGWCRRRADLLLVYDYMPNGSLDKYLFSGDATTPLLPWSIRFRVIRSVAAALLYLHEEWESVVLHRDVKASNVLLDGELNGRLGDFGLAKLYERGANPSTTRVVGTLGYLAPELTRTGKATTATDVFAFGALVLEVVCGRRPIEPKALQDELVLVDLVWEKWTAGKWREAVDSRLAGEFDDAEVEVSFRVGMMCSHPLPAARPAMRDVVRFFEDGDPSGVPELPSSPPAGGHFYEVGFEDFVHSYPSSSFEKVSWPLSFSPNGGTTGGMTATDEAATPFVFSTVV